MQELNLKCDCGKFQCTARVAPASGTRLVCYCQGCQEFAAYLGGGDIVDEFGGTDLFQMAPADFTITSGASELRSLRLTKKGPYRWYASCCDTPVANTVGPKIPFVSLFHKSMAPLADHDDILGPVSGHVNRDSALASLPGDRTGKAEIWTIIRVIRRIIGWKLRGKAAPNAFHHSNGAAISAPRKLFEPG